MGEDGRHAQRARPFKYPPEDVQFQLRCMWNLWNEAFARTPGVNVLFAHSGHRAAIRSAVEPVARDSMMRR